MISFSTDILKKQDIDIEGEEPPSFLEVENSKMISFKDNIHYKLHASTVSNGVLVKGSAAASYDGVCGRCLEKFKGKFGDHNIYLFYEELYGAELDVSENVRAALVVEVPINCICKDDCAGLCHICGNNLNKKTCNCKEPENEDSPWSQLNNLDL
jgi:DUF177 domain-containing protein